MTSPFQLELLKSQLSPLNNFFFSSLTLKTQQPHSFKTQRQRLKMQRLCENSLSALSPTLTFHGDKFVRNILPNSLNFASFRFISIYLTQFSYFKNILPICVETTLGKNLVGKHQNTQTNILLKLCQAIQLKYQQAQPSLCFNLWRLCLILRFLTGRAAETISNPDCPTLVTSSVWII